MISEIIEGKTITTQEDLAQELRMRGIDTTQATISRDIKELQLIKVPSGRDTYRYARPQQQVDSHRVYERLRRMLRDAVVKIDFSENLIVIHTLPGAAQGVCSALDQSGWEEVIGTVAGDDTIVLVIKPRDLVNTVVERLESLLE